MTPPATTSRPYVRRVPDLAPAPVAPGQLLPDRPRPHPAQQVLDLEFRTAADMFGPQPTPSSDLPCPRAWARQVAQALVEVLGAHRPPAQLVRWTTTDVYVRLARGAQAGAVRHPTRGRPPVVRTIRVDDSRDGVAEVAAVVVMGSRVRALAFRLVGRDGRWVMDQLEMG